MSEITIFTLENGAKPKTKFQKDLMKFLKECQFYTCKVDEDGELIMFDVNPYNIREFIKGSQTRITWEDLQFRYDSGER